MEINSVWLLIPVISFVFNYCVYIFLKLRADHAGHTSYRQTAFKNSGCEVDEKQVNQNGSFSSDTEEDTDGKSEAFGRPLADEVITLCFPDDIKFSSNAYVL